MEEGSKNAEVKGEEVSTKGVTPLPLESGSKIFGSTFELAKKGAVPFISEKICEHGNAFQCKIKGKEFVFVSGLDGYKEFENEENIKRCVVAPQMLMLGGSDDVAILKNGEAHRKIKSFLLDLMFDTNVLNAYMPTIIRSIDFIAEKIVDVKPFLSRDLCILISAVQGLSLLGGLSDEEINNKLKKGSIWLSCFLDGLSAKITIKSSLTNFGKGLNGVQKYFNFMASQLEMYEKKIEDTEKLYPTLIENMVAFNKKLKEEDRFSTHTQVSELVHAANAFTGIGSTTLAILYNISKNPETIKHIKEELHQKKFKLDNTVTLEKLDELTYLTNVIIETQRKGPVGIPLLFGVAERDFIVDGHVIPKGSKVAACLPTTNRDPTVYSNPTEFNPDRFAPENDERKRAHDPAFSFVAHGGGDYKTTHRCAGEKLVMAYFKVTLIRLINSDISWKFTPETPEFDYTTPTVLAKPPATLAFFSKKEDGHKNLADSTQSTDTDISRFSDQDEEEKEN
jgi:cytochrome P450